MQSLPMQFIQTTKPAFPVILQISFQIVMFLRHSHKEDLDTAMLSKVFEALLQIFTWVHKC